MMSEEELEPEQNPSPSEEVQSEDGAASAGVPETPMEAEPEKEEPAGAEEPETPVEAEESAGDAEPETPGVAGSEGEAVSEEAGTLDPSVELDSEEGGVSPAGEDEPAESKTEGRAAESEGSEAPEVARPGEEGESGDGPESGEAPGLVESPTDGAGESESPVAPILSIVSAAPPSSSSPSERQLWSYRPIPSGLPQDTYWSQLPLGRVMPWWQWVLVCLSTALVVGSAGHWVLTQGAAAFGGGLAGSDGGMDHGVSSADAGSLAASAATTAPTVGPPGGDAGGRRDAGSSPDASSLRADAAAFGPPLPPVLPLAQSPCVLQEASRRLAAGVDLSFPVAIAEQADFVLFAAKLGGHGVGLSWSPKWSRPLRMRRFEKLAGIERIQPRADLNEDFELVPDERKGRRWWPMAQSSGDYFAFTRRGLAVRHTMDDPAKLIARLPPAGADLRPQVRSSIASGFYAFAFHHVDRQELFAGVHRGGRSRRWRSLRVQGKVIGQPALGLTPQSALMCAAVEPARAAPIQLNWWQSDKRGRFRKVSGPDLGSGSEPHVAPLMGERWLVSWQRGTDDAIVVATLSASLELLGEPEEVTQSAERAQLQAINGGQVPLVAYTIDGTGGAQLWAQGLDCFGDE